MEKNRKDRDSSDEGDQEEVKKVERRKVKHANNAEDHFKEPPSINDSEEVTISITLKKASLELAEVTEALETLKRLGCLVEENKSKRRLSVESIVSAGGSSGYLGGSSSGLTSSTASPRSR